MAKGGNRRKVDFLYNMLCNDITDLVQQYKGDDRIELVEHFIAMFDELQEHYTSNDLSAYQKFNERQVQMLKKYRSAYVPYEQKHFDDLFHRSQVMLDKKYYNAEEFNALPKEQTTLTTQEIKQLSDRMNTMLHDLLHKIYTGADDGGESNTSLPEKEEDDTEMTEARRLLAIYYLLKSTLGIEQRSHGDVTDYARFAHLLLGKKFSKMADSSIYKKYKKLPNFNKGKQLISDLEYIKPYFQKLNLQKAFDLIEKEIADEKDSANQ